MATRRSAPEAGTPDTATAVGPWLVAGLVLAFAAVGVAVWIWTRRDPAADLIARQRELVTSSERLRDKDLDAVVRDVDRLSRDQARAVRAALGAEWQRIKQESITRYFDASAAERPALLDEDIARLQNYHRLLAGLNPMDMPGGPVWAPRGPRPKPGAAPPAPDAAKAEQTRRELEKMYDEARAARAKERGITLPQFR